MKQLRRRLLEAFGDADACEECGGTGKAYVGLMGRDTGALCSLCGGSGKKKSTLAQKTSPSSSSAVDAIRAHNVKKMMVIACVPQMRAYNQQPTDDDVSIMLADSQAVPVHKGDMSSCSAVVNKLRSISPTTPAYVVNDVPHQKVSLVTVTAESQGPGIWITPAMCGAINSDRIIYEANLRTAFKPKNIAIIGPLTNFNASGNDPMLMIFNPLFTIAEEWMAV